MLKRIWKNWEMATDAEKRTFALDCIKTLATIVVAFGVFLTYWSAQQERQLNAERLVTDRFSKAVEQLGSPNVSVRIGGIFALERIAKDSPRDHWPTIEVLSAFVRNNSPSVEGFKQEPPKVNYDDESLNLTRSMLRYMNQKKSPKIPTDVQSALTVIGRRKAENDAWGNDESKKNILNLSNTNLNAAYLREAALAHANLENTNLTDADLADADLHEANLDISDLRDTTLKRANLKGASLSGADLRQIDLEDAKLNKTSIWESNFEGARLWRTDFTDARIRLTNFKGSSLLDTNFRGTELQHTILQGVDLREARNLTREQIEKEKKLGFCNTIMPNGETNDLDCEALKALLK